jgi:hypothetical protein
MEITMSNSQRIEAATRQHVNAVLTNDQIVELVKVTSPDWKGGVYPSDAAGQRQEDGTITHRGKVAYGDLVLEYLTKNSFKVLWQRRKRKSLLLLRRKWLRLPRPQSLLKQSQWLLSAGRSQPARLAAYP